MKALNIHSNLQSAAIALVLLWKADAGASVLRFLRHRIISVLGAITSLILLFFVIITKHTACYAVVHLRSYGLLAQIISPHIMLRCSTTYLRQFRQGSAHLRRCATQGRFSLKKTRVGGFEWTALGNTRTFASVSAADLQFGQPLHETHPHLLGPGERM